MATDPLPITGTSQSQSTTQSPQSGVQSINTGTPASSVQPGTATELLNGQDNLPLYGTALPSMSLTDTQTVTAPAITAAPAKHHHHVKPALFGFSIVLFVLAAVLVWTISRSERKHDVT